MRAVVSAACQPYDRRRTRTTKPLRRGFAGCDPGYTAAGGRGEIVCRRTPGADIRRIAPVLAGAEFPAAQWQLVMHVEDYGADARTRADVWALPVGTYPDLGAVLRALGLPARGHVAGDPSPRGPWLRGRERVQPVGPAPGQGLAAH